MFRTSLFGMLSVAVLSGCGTLDNLLNERTPYGGLACDLDYVIHGTGLDQDIWLRPVVALDSPLSAVADTATLPITLIEPTKRWFNQQADHFRSHRRKNETLTLQGETDPESALNQAITNYWNEMK